MAQQSHSANVVHLLPTAAIGARKLTTIARPSAIDRFMVFSFELFANLISPHATKVARTADCFGCPSHGRGDGAGASIFGTATQQTVTLRTIPVTNCFSYDLGRRRETDGG